MLIHGDSLKVLKTYPDNSVDAIVVKLVSRPDQIVLDPFGGSGTTAIACVTTGRQYILIEMGGEYIDIAKARVAHYEQQG